MAEEEKTKTRKRLTVTAMYEAICDLHFAVLGADARTKQDPPMLMQTEKKTGTGKAYVVGLFTRISEEPFDAKDLVAHAEHADGIEEAVSALLVKMQERFEAKRREVLAGLDSVLTVHHGALKGARSKIREKKT